MNFNALWGLVFSVGVIGAGYRYFNNRSEKEVSVINVTPYKDEEDREEGRNKTLGGYRESITEGSGESTTRERRVEQSFTESPIEDTTLGQEREMEDDVNADSRNEQEHKEYSRTTPHTKFSDSDIPEIPELD